jgi:hypothetical protein
MRSTLAMSAATSASDLLPSLDMNFCGLSARESGSAVLTRRWHLLCRHLGSVVETAALIRVQTPAPLLLTSLGVPTRHRVIDLRDRSVSTHERRVEPSAVGTGLLWDLAGEPTRVLTKVNFEQRPEEGKGSEGFTGSGRD